LDSGGLGITEDTSVFYHTSLLNTLSTKSIIVLGSIEKAVST